MKVKSKAPKIAAGIIALAGTAAAIAPASAAAHSPAAAHAAVTAKSKAGSVECDSDSTDLSKRLSRAIARALKSRKGTVSVAFYDRATKTACTYNAHKAFDSASTVKPVVLGALLLARDGHLTQEEKTLARKMIVNSDNAATTALWRKLSDLSDPQKPDPVKIQRFLDAAGMTDTVLGRDGSWGLTQVSAADQLKLLRLLTAAPS
ncbi:serine hydrolase [Streptomyces sp. NPDC001774]